jgi:xanthosine utilization system XapX-like protein
MWILTAGQYAAAISAILALLGIIVKYGILKPIKSYIDQATYAISPDANGGKSLPDVVCTLARIEKKLDLLKDRISKIEKKQVKKA